MYMHAWLLYLAHPVEGLILARWATASIPLWIIIIHLNFVFVFLQEDSLQFFKEEKTDGAVYNLYLKKVRYHTAPEDVGIGGFPGAGNSTFYLNIPASIPKKQNQNRSVLYTYCTA